MYMADGNRTIIENVLNGTETPHALKGAFIFNRMPKGVLYWAEFAYGDVPLTDEARGLLQAMLDDPTMTWDENYPA